MTAAVSGGVGSAGPEVLVAEAAVGIAAGGVGIEIVRPPDTAAAGALSSAAVADVGPMSDHLNMLITWDMKSTEERGVLTVHEQVARARDDHIFFRVPRLFTVHV